VTLNRLESYEHYRHIAHAQDSRSRGEMPISVARRAQVKHYPVGSRAVSQLDGERLNGRSLMNVVGDR